MRLRVMRICMMFTLVMITSSADGLGGGASPLAGAQNFRRRIQSALTRAAVTVELDHRTMVRLGLYAAHPRTAYLATEPGTLQ